MVLRNSILHMVFDSYITGAIPSFFFCFLQEYEPLSGKHEVVYRGDDPWEVRREGGDVLFFLVCVRELPACWWRGGDSS